MFYNCKTHSIVPTHMYAYENLKHFCFGRFFSAYQSDYTLPGGKHKQEPRVMVTILKCNIVTHSWRPIEALLHH